MTTSYYSIFKQRKGSILDGFAIMIYFFVFAIMVVVSFTVYNSLIDNNFFTLLNTTGNANLQSNLTRFQNNTDAAYSVLDVLSIFVLIGTTISSIVGALLLRSHPAFFFISIIIMLTQVIVAMALANSWDTLINVPEFDDAQQRFVITNFFLSNFPLVIFVMVLLVSVVLYAINPLGE